MKCRTCNGDDSYEASTLLLMCNTCGDCQDYYNLNKANAMLAMLHDLMQQCQLAESQGGYLDSSEVRGMIEKLEEFKSRERKIAVQCCDSVDEFAIIVFEVFDDGTAKILETEGNFRSSQERQEWFKQNSDRLRNINQTS